MSTQPTRFLLGAAARAPQRLALIEARTELALTYGQLATQVDAAARSLSAMPRSLAFLFCRPDAGSLIAYLAAVQAGHAVALLDARLEDGAKRALLAAYQPEVLLGTAAGDGDGPGLPLADGLCLAWRTSDAPGPPLHPALAVLLCTSGSTGSPKLVRLSRANVESNAAAIAEALTITAEDRAIANLPMQYAYGLSVVNSHLWAGAGLLLLDESVIRPAFWRTATRFGCTAFAGVPFTYEMLARVGFEPAWLPSLRTMTQAGGRLADAVIAELHCKLIAHGGRFIPMYGQTEATARITYLPPGLLPDKLGSVGRAIPGGRLHIELEGQPAGEARRAGEVVYHGPNVMLGYATRRDDLGLGDQMGSRLATGDLGYLDDDGCLYLTGRTKRIAKLYGLRLNLDELEQKLCERGQVAVVEREGTLWFFCGFGDPEEHEALKLELAASLKLHHSVLRFQPIGEVPRTSSGKVDYERLKASAT